MFNIGRGRYKTEGYPIRSNGDALAALSNRYLSPLIVPDPFTSLATYYVAAANVTRRASGLFMVSAQSTLLLAAPDTHSWGALIFPGSVASGGVLNGDWRVSVGSAVVLAPEPAPITVSITGSSQTPDGITLVGINATPAPAGASVIAIVASTTGPTLLTPGAFFVSAFELP